MLSKYFSINKNGHSIRCKLYYSDIRSIKSVIINGHGFGGHKDNNAAEKFAEFVMKKYKDAAVLCFDAPSHGDDVKKVLALSDCAGYIGLVADYAASYFKAQRLFYYATSFGGYLVLKYISENDNPFCKIGLRCPAVNMYDVLSGSIMEPSELKALGRGRPIEVGFDRKIKINSRLLDDLKEADISGRDFSRFKDDILILHGTNDEVVPFGVVEEFAERNTIPFIPVEGADHRFRSQQHMSNAIKEIVGFFEL